MTTTNVIRRALLAWLWLLPQAQAAQPLTPGAYELTTETVMPHLEEALRYATTRETRCLGELDLRAAFPILRHDSLKGCTLDESSRDEGELRYLLHCAGSSGSSGEAVWQVGANRLIGRLEVKLGGKNMTFSQRVSARLLGACETAPR